MIEAEHIGLNDPCAGRHAIEMERPVIVGKSHQAALALRRSDCRSRDQLAPCFYGARLAESSSFKNKWQAHCQKHENLEH